MSGIVQTVKQAGLSVVPQTVCTNPKIVNGIKYIGEKVSSAEQRLILGATALLTQPYIDGKNKSVDEKTRKVSVARTIAKIIAGTTTGFLIRKGCIKGIKVLSQMEGPNVSKIKTFFTPKGININSEAFEQYRNAMGTIVALVVMMFTNFAIDAPLTRFLTNRLVKRGEAENGINK